MPDRGQGTMLPIHRCEGHQSVRTRQVTWLMNRHSRARIFVRSFGCGRTAEIVRGSTSAHGPYFEADFTLETADSCLPRAARFRDHRCRHRTTSSESVGRGRDCRGWLAARLYWNCEHSRESRAEAWREPENSEGRCGCGKRSTSDSRAGGIHLLAGACVIGGGAKHARRRGPRSHRAGGAERNGGGGERRHRRDLGNPLRQFGLYAFYRLPNGNYTIRVSLFPLSFLAPASSPPSPENRHRHSPPHRPRRTHHRPQRQRPAPPPLRWLARRRLFSRSDRGMPKSNGETSNPSSSPPRHHLHRIRRHTGAIHRDWTTPILQSRHDRRREWGSRNRCPRPGLSQAGSATLPAFATTGGTQTLIPMSAIDEIQIRTTNASSEHARSPGAQTAIVTRSGTDRFKGSLQERYVHEAIAARDWFANAGTAEGREAIGIAMYPLEGRYFRGASSTSERGNISRSTVPWAELPSCRHSKSGTP